MLENDKVVLQKFILEPGQWERLHTHPGNQIYVHIRGGEWTVRRRGQETVSHAEDGSVGWSEAVGEDEQHESRRFHDVMLSYGAMPMSVLPKHVDWFIEQERI